MTELSINDVLVLILLVPLVGLVVLLYVDALLADPFDEELRQLLEEEQGRAF